MPYRITSHYSTCYHMIKQKSNCKSHETIAKPSNTYSFHSHHTNSIRKHQIFVAVTPSSSSNATLILNASQHRHGMREMAGKQVPTRFKPRPHHLTPSTSRSRRTQLNSRGSCGLSARRAVDGRRRPISSRCSHENLRRRGGGDVNRCKIQTEILFKQINNHHHHHHCHHHHNHQHHHHHHHHRHHHIFKFS